MAYTSSGSSSSSNSDSEVRRVVNEPKTEKSKDKSNEVEPESVRKHSDAPIIEDWVSDDEKEKVKKKEVKPSIKRINFVKATTDSNPREIVKNGERKPRKGQNQIKTGQKREACRSQEKFKAVAVDKGRKTKENKKRMVENAYTVKDKQKRTKSDQNRTKTGGVAKPGEVKNSYSE
nr:hypothetical protein [Tanacetum cinerariifolium]